MDHHELQDRVLRLEKENRWAKRLLLGLAVILGVSPLLSFAINDAPKNASYGIVYASKFVVRDPRTDKTRATLTHQTMEGGWAGITLWDNEGQPRAEFKLWEDGRTHILMMDERRQELSRLSVFPDGTPSLLLGGTAVQLDSASNSPLQTDGATRHR